MASVCGGCLALLDAGVPLTTSVAGVAMGVLLDDVDDPVVRTRVEIKFTARSTPARWRGGAGSSPLDGASAATSSPRNDLVKNYHVPDTGAYRYPRDRGRVRRHGLQGERPRPIILREVVCRRRRSNSGVPERGDDVDALTGVPRQRRTRKRH